MKALIQNKKVHFNYEIIEEFEVGMKLHGFEVKAIRKGVGSLEGAYVTIRGDEAFLIGATIPPFQVLNAPKDYDSARNRKLLLTKREITELGGTEKQKGLTILPIMVYNKGRKLKLKIGIGRGKKKFDKRQSIKKRDSDREIRRQMKYE